MRRLSLLVLAAVLAMAGAADADAAKKKAKKKKAKPPPPPARVLVYSGTAGFRHNSIPIGNAVIARLARLTGKYTVEFAEAPAQLTKERLTASDIVLWNSTTGAESPFADEQEQAYMKWIECGGGHMGVHASTDSYKDWAGWRELTGAFFKMHPITPGSASDDAEPEHEGHGEPQATLLVADGASPITSPWHGKDSFLMRDEFYALDGDPSRVIADFKPLLAFGGFTEPEVALLFGSQYADEQPLAWTGSYRGKNRLHYTNLGHSGATWQRGDFQDSLLEAITWVQGKRPDLSCLRAAGVAPPAPAAKPKKKTPSKRSTK